ncbi:UNKNOWN [Stylonychia lemnae]|uniref:Uncharacterized protein n=1 Tax=Stylonychia lemnae TaxID=5949 RepID=A0A078BBB0_STYLE|nr:UNKNOWN [Stylonychia lemnae]|eukprot:CDW91845.1 UNKNOWN [Stylonychia lemnae]
MGRMRKAIRLGDSNLLGICIRQKTALVRVWRWIQRHGIKIQNNMTVIFITKSKPSLLSIKIALNNKESLKNKIKSNEEHQRMIYPQTTQNNKNLKLSFPIGQKPNSIVDTTYHPNNNKLNISNVSSTSNKTSKGNPIYKNQHQEYIQNIIKYTNRSHIEADNSSITQKHQLLKKDLIIENEYQRAKVHKEGLKRDGLAQPSNHLLSTSDRSMDLKQNEFDEDTLMEIMFSSDVLISQFLILIQHANESLSRMKPQNLSTERTNKTFDSRMETGPKQQTQKIKKSNNQLENDKNFMNRMLNNHSGLTIKSNQKNSEFQSKNQLAAAIGPSQAKCLNQSSDRLISDDDELNRLGKLSLINASARFQLISANQQLLDFQLNRFIKNSKKVKNHSKTINDSGMNNKLSFGYQSTDINDTQDGIQQVSNLNQMHDNSADFTISDGFRESNRRESNDGTKQNERLRQSYKFANPVNIVQEYEY